MKKTKIIYWSLTGFLSAAFLMSSSMYLTKNEMLVTGFQQMGYPLFLLSILGVAKLLGAFALINPWFPKLREWAYAGFTIVLLGAAWSHVATNTPFLSPLIFLLVLAVSYYYNGKLSVSDQKEKFPGYVKAH